MYYASFILTQDGAEESNKKNDDMYSVTGFTGTFVTTFYTQHTQLNIPKELGYAVDKYQSESKLKLTYVALGNLQDFVEAISHKPSKWEYLEHCHMTPDFLGGFGNYLGQRAKKKTTVKFQ